VLEALIHGGHARMAYPGPPSADRGWEGGPAVDGAHPRQPIHLEAPAARCTPAGEPDSGIPGHLGWVD